MFNFFKKFVKPKQELQTITLLELPAWLQTETAKRTEEAQKAFETIFNEHREQLGLLGTSIEALRVAPLLNPNIPERAKQLMEGNREEFIRIVERVAHGVASPKQFEDAQRYNLEIQAILKELLPAISRPFQVLQEFFAHETKDVWNHVHLVEQQAIALAKLNETYKLDAIQSLRKELNEHQALAIQQQRAREDASRCSEDLAAVEREQKSLRERITDLESSAEYASLLAVKQKIQSTTDLLKQERARIIEQFSSIEPALKKYEHMTVHNRALIKDYLVNPVETLVRDRDFAVLGIISATRREVDADRIDLKDRKKEKVLAVMSEMTKENLSAFLRTYNALLQKQNALIAEAHATRVLSEISSARESLRATDQKSESAQQALKNAAQLLEQKPNFTRIETELKTQFSLELRK